jgi:hypothetical protein
MKNTTVLTLFLLLFVSHWGYSQSQEKAYALLLMNFARNIQWPPNNIGSAFTIGVMGYPPLMSEMQTLSQSKLIGGKQIILKEINSPADAVDCEIVFLPAFKSKKLPEILKTVGTSNTLIVTNTFQLTSGSGINFVLKDGKLAYQISSKTVEARGLKVPASVKNLGEMVN